MMLFTFATSPYARKVRMTLELKRVSFDSIERCYSLDRKKICASRHREPKFRC